MCILLSIASSCEGRLDNKVQHNNIMFYIVLYIYVIDYVIDYVMMLYMMLY